MMNFTAEELVCASHGNFLAGLPKNLIVNGIFTDTRQNGAGKLFVALRGEKFDAHDFLDQAIASGCSALCIEKRFQSRLGSLPSIPVLLTEDTLKAYQAFGGFHRKRFSSLKVIAVTGSVGKTSVKEMLRAICEAAAPGQVLATEGNTNNQIGVVQNLLRLNSDHCYAVLEAGTNHHGELTPLSRIIAPDAALINSIAPCHLEFLGDLDGVAEEKSHIFDALCSTGTAVIPAESAGHEILENAAKKFHILRFGSGANASCRGVYHGGNLNGSSFSLTFPDGRTFDLSWSLSGAHQAINAAAAAAAALSQGISPEIIVRGLPHTKLPGMRLKITSIQGVTYINDAYNANPASMEASIQWLSEFADSQKLILVLGEMRELGEQTQAEHDRILDLAKRLLPGVRILPVGALFHGVADSDTARSELEELQNDGDLIFAKGSRGTAVERVLPPEAR